MSAGVAFTHEGNKLISVCTYMYDIPSVDRLKHSITFLGLMEIERVYHFLHLSGDVSWIHVFRIMFIMAM